MFAALMILRVINDNKYEPERSTYGFSNLFLHESRHRDRARTTLVLIFTGWAVLYGLSTFPDSLCSFGDLQLPKSDESAALKYQRCLHYNPIQSLRMLCIL